MFEAVNVIRILTFAALAVFVVVFWLEMRRLVQSFRAPPSASAEMSRAKVPASPETRFGGHRMLAQDSQNLYAK